MKTNASESKAPKYALIVEWSDEDQTWIGRCPEVMFGGVHGDDPASVFVELQQAVEEVLQIKKEGGHPAPEAIAGKKFSGKFNLRVTPELHRTLTLRAKQERQSLNDYIVARLEPRGA